MRVSPKTNPSRRDRSVSVPAESASETANVNHAPDLLFESTLKPQTDETHHFAEALDQRDLQHHQRPILGQTLEAHPTQSFISQVGEILLLSRLQRAPNSPLLGPLKVPGRAHPTWLP